VARFETVDTPSRPEAAQFRQASLALALEGLAVHMTRALGDSGVHAILLKGPALATWLYPGQPRPYSDVDLLICDLDRDAQSQLMFFHTTVRTTPAHMSVRTVRLSISTTR
jgi:hypothetical protein